MADLAPDAVSENYKGLLIQYCQQQGLKQPQYTETQQGPSDAPLWQVTVSYGDDVYETPEPVPGSKKFAHQIASQQILAKINSRRESFLAGDDKTETQPVPVPEENGAPATHIEVPTPLVSRALIIANERLTTSQPSRYRMITDTEFSEKLSKLTLQIVRSLLKTAEKDKITFQ